MIQTEREWWRDAAVKELPLCKRAEMSVTFPQFTLCSKEHIFILWWFRGATWSELIISPRGSARVLSEPEASAKHETNLDPAPTRVTVRSRLLSNHLNLNCGLWTADFKRPYLITPSRCLLRKDAGKKADLEGRSQRGWHERCWYSSKTDCVVFKI